MSRQLGNEHLLTVDDLLPADESGEKRADGKQRGLDNDGRSDSTVSSRRFLLQIGSLESL